MSYELAIDLGTAYTAAAVRRDGRIDALPLGIRAHIVPTVVFIGDDRIVAGEHAAALGDAQPARMVREFKRRVGSDEPLVVGGRPVQVGQLLTATLQFVRSRAVELLGAEPSATVLTCPVEWGEFRRQQLVQAGVAAGLPAIELATEPESAAAFYASTQPVPDHSLVGVYDFGGGTFDASLLRKTPTGFTLVGRPTGDEQLGGVDLDRLLLDHITRPISGHLRSLDPDDPSVAQALAKLREVVVHAKELLGVELVTTVSVVLPGLVTELRVTRREFEELARPAIDRSLDVFEQCLQQSGVTSSDLSRVLLVGGTSRIPLVAELVAQRFGVPVALDAHPKFAVCLGALHHNAAETAAPPTPPPVPPAPAPAPAEAPLPRPAPDRSRRTTLLWGAGLVALVMAAVAGFLVLRPDDTDFALALPAGAPLPDDRLVWTRMETEQLRRLMIGDARGGTAVALTGNTTDLHHLPVLSASRRTVLYTRTSIAERTNELWAITIEGDGETRVATGLADDARAAISPDDRYVVFAVARSGGTGTDLRLLDRKDGSARLLTDDPAPDGDPAWSPSGRTVAFWKKVDDRQHLWSVDVATGQVAQLTDTAGAADADPAFSPDGARIAFARTSAQKVSLHVMAADGTGAREVADPGVGGIDADPTWSPDGTELAFESRRAQPRPGLYAVRVDNGTVRAVTGAGSFLWEHHPAWGRPAR